MNYKVLVVDDSKLARMAFVRSLSALRPQWTRVEAANAEEAMALLKQAEPDLAVLDFNMPGKDGLQLVEQLRQERPAIPVAVISANHQREVIDRTHAAAATFLSKPIADRDLEMFLLAAERQILAAGHD